MLRKSVYSAEFKASVVLELLQGNKELGELAAEHNLNPNMIRNWRREFLDNASRVSMRPTLRQRLAERRNTWSRSAIRCLSPSGS